MPPLKNLCFDLSKLILPGAKSQTFDIDSEIALDQDSKIAISGKITLVPLENGIIVANFDLKSVLTVECVRCLKNFKLPIKLKFEQEYFPKGQELEKTDFVYSLTTLILDATEAIRQETILNLPSKPLCKKNCLGLCPLCGKNLNLFPKHKHKKETTGFTLKDLLKNN